MNFSIASAFSKSLVSSNDNLPTTRWTLPPASLRNSTLPALYSLTALATSGVTVPARGEGIRPRGPSTRPSGPTTPIMSGRGDAHVEIGPAVLDLLGQFFAADVVGAGRLGRFGQLSPLAKTTTRSVLPMPCGNTIEPRTI